MMVLIFETHAYFNASSDGSVVEKCVRLPVQGLWQAKCTIIRETKVYKAKTMVLTINLG